jgi:hypothetical protein
MTLPLYDEDRILGDYVCTYYGNFMTEFEVKVYMSLFVESKAKQLEPKSPLRKKMEQAWSAKNTPGVAAAMSSGMTAFQVEVAKRILRDHGRDVFINRCSKCARIVRTPRACQCFWCGHDWHTAA